MNRKILWTLLLLCGAVLSLPAQLRTVTGTVTDAETGEPLTGVAVKVKGKAKGAYTSVKGTYSLELSPEDVLLFSYMGMLPAEETVGQRTVINVALEVNTAKLDEIVVTALGIKRSEKSLPYATQKIGAQELTRVPSSNLLNNLAGKTAGMTVSTTGAGVGSSVKVLLRGNRSIYGNNQPLYVVDGTPINSASFTKGTNEDAGYGGEIDPGDGLAGLNPEDIADVNVLKGASAAALYGARAANGVIMITTKRGAEDRLHLSVNSSFQADVPYISYRFQDRYQMGSKGISQPSNLQWGEKGDPKTLSNSYIRDFFRTGKLFINGFSLSGGSKKIRNYFSYNNTKGDGIMPANSYNKHNLALRSGFSLFDGFLDVDASSALMKQDIDHAPSAPGRYFNPIVGLYLFPEGNAKFQEFKDKYEIYDPSKNINKGNWTHEEDINKNPYWLVNNYNYEYAVQKAISKLNLSFNLSPELKLKLRGSYDYSRMDYSRKVNWGITVVSGDQGGRYEEYDEWVKDRYADALLSYNKTLSNMSISATVGASISDYQSAKQGVRVDLKIPNFFHLNNYVGKPKMENKGEHRQLQSYFGTMSLGWNDFIFLDLTARNDISSTLPKGNRSYFYPSIGSSLIFSELLQRQGSKPQWLSFGKLRISWTQVGNDMPWGKTLVYDALNEAGDVSKNTVAPFKDLKPERSTAFELGLNLRALDNRIHFDAAFYNTNTTNQYFLVDAPEGTSYSKYYINAGTIRNQGWELTLGGEPIRNRDFRWETTLNFSTNKNTVVSLPEQYADKGIILGKGAYDLVLKEGQEWGEMYMKRVPRDDKGRVIVELVRQENGSYLPQLRETNETVRVGNINPDYMLGWNNQLQWKNLSLNFQIDARVGGDVISNTQAFLNRYGRSQETADARDAGGVKLPAVGRITEKVDGKIKERFVDFKDPIAAQDWYTSAEGNVAIYSATNVRLRELSLSYSLPKRWLEKTKYIKDLRLSLIGRNLLYFYREAPFDPDLVLSSGSNVATNQDNFSIPLSRTIGASININF